MVLYFRVKKKKEAELCLTERITNRVMDKAKEAIEDILGDNSEIPIRFRNWYKVTTLTLFSNVNKIYEQFWKLSASYD